eukprot:CAMPEP_0184338252 /NCGR_PEP_ID=MMETSP1089-20130417/6786_1 /TAXON_ID=38269 ORGANISM="Gloeochaete wittrockiana, Strain SAG46.84" /NCGR_SAMPLE_ID=MMETSP1089 /ASSEMBLY_ACC=CAM_ASM_000445 /LENGTH=66 /DNA_ID=CAMNT_0026664657 /DNA_START=29 /DNA_END=229 /DNA_ORIENTATION=+
MNRAVLAFFALVALFVLSASADKINDEYLETSFLPEGSTFGRAFENSGAALIPAVATLFAALLALF